MDTVTTTNKRTRSNKVSDRCLNHQRITEIHEDTESNSSVIANPGAETASIVEGAETTNTIESATPGAETTSFVEGVNISTCTVDRTKTIDNVTNTIFKDPFMYSSRSGSRITELFFTVFRARSKTTSVDAELYSYSDSDSEFDIDVTSDETQYEHCRNH